MNIKIYLLLLMTFATQLSFSQSCGCEKNFLLLKNLVETNYVGFKDKATGKNKNQYDAFSNKILEKVKKETEYYRCFGLLYEWISFFNDGHLNIIENTSFATPDSILKKSLKPEFNEINITDNELKRLQKSIGVEGIYHDYYFSQKIAIVKKGNSFRDYVGVAIDSKSESVKPHQVIFELKELSKKSFITYYINNDKYRGIGRYAFDGNSFNYGNWTKEIAGSNENQSSAIVGAKKLSDKTFYIQVKSFEATYAKDIDSVFKANEKILASTPNLILDIRDNGGGSDFSFNPITPYIYTNPIIITGIDALASEQNIKGWLDVLNDSRLNEYIKADISRKAKLMELHKGELINIMNDDTIFYKGIKRYPKKVVILINGNCASSAEQFISFAKQSKKVTLMGQNSNGVYDYSNVRGISSPEYPFILCNPTTRNRCVDKGQGIDGIGFKPDIYLSPNKDWIKEALNYLENKR